MGQIKNIKLHIVTDIKIVSCQLVHNARSNIRTIRTSRSFGLQNIGGVTGVPHPQCSTQQDLATHGQLETSRAQQVWTGGQQTGCEVSTGGIGCYGVVLSERRFCGSFSKGCCRSPETLRNRMNTWIMIMCTSCLVICNCN